MIKNRFQFAAVTASVIVAGMAWVLCGGLDTAHAWWSGRQQAQAAKGEAALYEVAKKAGYPIETCSQASKVAAAYSAAGDLSGYQRWKDIEAGDCRAAKLP